MKKAKPSSEHVWSEEKIRIATLLTDTKEDFLLNVLWFKKHKNKPSTLNMANYIKSMRKIYKAETLKEWIKESKEPFYIASFGQD